MTGFSHEYKRHGTTTLFAALDIVTGQIRTCRMVKKGELRGIRLGRYVRAGSAPASQPGTAAPDSTGHVATPGEVTGHYRRRRRVEFLDSMNQIVKDHLDREIHVILDNLNTHKPKRDMWLALHKNVHLHYTPIHASWLNQIEVWFSILSRQALSASFHKYDDVL